MRSRFFASSSARNLGTEFHHDIWYLKFNSNTWFLMLFFESNFPSCIINYDIITLHFMCSNSSMLTIQNFTSCCTFSSTVICPTNLLSFHKAAFDRSRLTDVSCGDRHTVVTVSHRPMLAKESVELKPYFNILKVSHV